MEKRLILAVALSLLILLTWSVLAPKPAPSRAPQEVVQATAVVPSQAAERQVPAITAPSLFTLKQNDSEIAFIEQSASIDSIKFQNYKSHKFELNKGFLLLTDPLNYKRTSFSDTEVVFVQKAQNKEFIKRFLISKSPYTMELEISWRNLSSVSLDINDPIVLAAINLKNTSEQARYQDFVIGLTEKTLHANGRKDELLENAQFVAFRDRYFCAILQPLSGKFDARIQKINNAESLIMLVPKDMKLDPGKIISQKFSIYLGPQDLQTINSFNYKWAGVINYGTFDIISQALLQLLEFINGLVHNLGLAIIILSIAIYLILFPLTLKQMRAMKEMQALQPRIAELKQLYKDNPQKLHKETLELYKEHKVNPFGGCLPLLLQMPIFFALYQALIRSVALKGSTFLWIKDLSEPDRLAIPFSLPMLGNHINILPILMTIIMFFQQKVSMASTSSEYAEQQKIMLIIFPLMFGFIFYNMPAGLVLYWLINSLLTAAYQFKVNSSK
ncbi:MAG: membrane protein insertase YidC [Candidatus Omnitrophica bacterium]|nr:membrane protein insertase YidC [Candidatus Omnitrophota bacterium]